MLAADQLPASSRRLSISENAWMSLQFELAHDEEDSTSGVPHVLVVGYFDGQKMYLTAQQWSKVLEWKPIRSKEALFYIDSALSAPFKIVLRSLRWPKYCVYDRTAGNKRRLSIDTSSTCPFALEKECTQGLPQHLFDSKDRASLSTLSSHSS